MISKKLLQDGTLGVMEATRFSGLGRTHLYDLMRRGDLPFIKIGTRRLIPRALVTLLARGVEKQEKPGSRVVLPSQTER